jgi:hypothetical protein
MQIACCLSYDQKNISDQDYARLKGQINQYRRAHTAETETGSDVTDEATVFAQEDSVKDSAAAAPGTVDDATQVLTDVEDEATQVADSIEQSNITDFDVTGGTDISGVDIDLSAVGDPSITSATGPAETGWSDPSAQPSALDTASLGPGSIIKQRFKLISVLGIGGMGKVYKGLTAT